MEFTLLSPPKFQEQRPQQVWWKGRWLWGGSPPGNTGPCSSWVCLIVFQPAVGSLVPLPRQRGKKRRSKESRNKGGWLKKALLWALFLFLFFFTQHTQKVGRRYSSDENNKNKDHHPSLAFPSFFVSKAKKRWIHKIIYKNNPSTTGHKFPKIPAGFTIV